MIAPKTQAGLTLIEMMIALVIGMLVTLASIYVYLGQSRVVVHQARKEQANQAGSIAFEVLSRLLRHAEVGATVIAYPGSGAAAQPNTAAVPELAGDGVTVDFVLPSGYDIWPNDTAPYTDTAIRIGWSNSGADAYRIRIAKAASVAALGAATLTPVAGANSGPDARIVNLDFWPLQSDGRTLQASASDAASGGYRLTLTTRAGLADPGYVNPNDANGPLKHYRTTSIVGVVASRN